MYQPYDDTLLKNNEYRDPLSRAGAFQLHTGAEATLTAMDEAVKSTDTKSLCSGEHEKLGGRGNYIVIGGDTRLRRWQYHRYSLTPRPNCRATLYSKPATCVPYSASAGTSLKKPSTPGDTQFLWRAPAAIGLVMADAANESRLHFADGRAQSAPPFQRSGLSALRRRGTLHKGSGPFRPPSAWSFSWQSDFVRDPEHPT